MSATDFEEKKLEMQQDILKKVELKQSKKIVVAIDGPSASGKGTLSKKLAERLGYAFLDTGAIYRAVALATLEMDGNPASVEDVKLAVGIVKRNLTPELLESWQLRQYKVSEAASKVAAIPEVRAELIDYQKEFAKNPPGNVGGVVLDGRDIGTVICPEADFKFFVTASAEERAKRRYEQLKCSNTTLTYEQVLEDMKKRDMRDSGRKTAPTKQAEDAYLLDTTAKSPDECIEEVVSCITSKMIAELEG